MIALNATLLMQMFHFMIAYLIIRYLFLVPILKIIRVDHAHTQQIINEITSYKEQIQLNEQQKKKIWKQCQHFFALHTPAIFQIEHSLYKIQAQAIKPVELNTKELEMRTQKLSQAITDHFKKDA